MDGCTFMSFRCYTLCSVWSGHSHQCMNQLTTMHACVLCMCVDLFEISWLWGDHVSGPTCGRTCIREFWATCYVGRLDLHIKDSWTCIRGGCPVLYQEILSSTLCGKARPPYRGGVGVGPGSACNLFSNELGMYPPRIHAAFLWK